MYSLQSQSTGIIFPEMIENLYGDDSKDDVLERIDIQLEEDPKTLRYENYFRVAHGTVVMCQKSEITYFLLKFPFLVKSYTTDSIFSSIG